MKVDVLWKHQRVLQHSIFRTRNQRRGKDPKNEDAWKEGQRVREAREPQAQKAAWGVGSQGLHAHAHERSPTLAQLTQVSFTTQEQGW